MCTDDGCGAGGGGAERGAGVWTCCPDDGCGRACARCGSATVRAGCEAGWRGSTGCVLADEAADAAFDWPPAGDERCACLAADRSAGVLDALPAAEVGDAAGAPDAAVATDAGAADGFSSAAGGAAEAGAAAGLPEESPAADAPVPVETGALSEGASGFVAGSEVSATGGSGLSDSSGGDQSSNTFLSVGFARAISFGMSARMLAAVSAARASWSTPTPRRTLRRVSSFFSASRMFASFVFSLAIFFSDASRCSRRLRLLAMAPKIIDPRTRIRYPRPARRKTRIGATGRRQQNIGMTPAREAPLDPNAGM